MPHSRPRLVPAARLVVATRNAGKARELAAVAGDFFATTEPLQPGMLDGFEPDETGRSFRDNACLKARVYAKALASWVLADDSGLCVDALDGRPGVRSARLAADSRAGSGEAANNAHLLRLIDDVPDDRRGARFECVLALSDPSGEVLVTTWGAVYGRLLRSPRGENGFGYDPLFVPHGYDVTTAQLLPEEKATISHRGVAARRLADVLPRLT